MALAEAIEHEMGRSTIPPAKSIVFVVDDDISVRESLELLIHAAGWHPELFASAQAFLDHPPASVPHCLVLDISLPGLNGLDLQKRVIAERPEMPIIFITGTRRRAENSSGDESRRCRIPDKAIPMTCCLGGPPRARTERGVLGQRRSSGTERALCVPHASRTAGNEAGRCSGF